MTDRNRVAIGTDTRVDDAKEYRIGREIIMSDRENECRLLDIAWGNIMGQVDHCCGRTLGLNDALHYADEPVAEPKVRKHNDGTTHSLTAHGSPARTTSE